MHDETELKFPPPPDSLPVPRQEECLRIEAGERLARIYFRGGRHPALWNGFRYFGPTTARFDPHTGDGNGAPAQGAKGILYGAANIQTCCAEVFQDTRVINRYRNTPWLVLFTLTRSVDLLDVRGSWPTRAGASSLINNGRRERARTWARAIHAAFPHLEGIAYASSMDGHNPAFALFERARSAIASRPTFNQPLNVPGLETGLKNIAWTIGYHIL